MSSFLGRDGVCESCSRFGPVWEPSGECDDCHTRATVRAALVDFCRSQNPAFKRDRWLNYLHGKCGPNGGKLKKTREAERLAKFVGNLLAN